MSGYDASAIKVLSEEEAAERFGWADIAELTKKYPFVDPRVMARMRDAAEKSGTDWGLIQRWYLDGERTRAGEEEKERVRGDLEGFQAAYIELVKDQVTRRMDGEP